MLDELKNVVTQHPVCIPVPVVADLLQMSPACLRASIEQNRCPFGFSWTLGDRSGFKIPTATFVAWFLKGIPASSLTV